MDISKNKTSHEKIYDEYYSNQDDKKLSWFLSSSDRKAFIESIYKNLKTPIKVLDIGCGNGQNTNWIGNVELNEWLGIDTASPELLKIDIPKNGEFIHGDFNDKKIFEKICERNKKFDLIVDQGGILTSLDDINEIKQYLEKVSKILDSNGVFCFLVTFNNKDKVAYTDILPDGRKRRFFTLENFSEAPFSDFFTINTTKINNYSPESSSNPYSKADNNKKEISLINVSMSKKNK